MKDKNLLLSLFFISLSASLMAQVPTVPISISKNRDMTFGIVAASSGGGTVVLSSSGLRTASGGAILPSFNGSVSAAQFTVTGDPNYTYTITLPTTYTLYEFGIGPESMIVNAFTSTPSTTGNLLGGTETILVGATLNVSGSQTEGSYTNSSGFEVIVNYN